LSSHPQGSSIRQIFYIPENWCYAISFLRVFGVTV
jgi:hypothetical protein